MLDLDVIEARAAELSYAWEERVDNLVAELRAAREVVEAAEKLETDIESDLDWLHENLIAALAAYRTVVDALEKP